MYKGVVLVALLAACPAVACAAMLDVSGFGGYTTTGIKSPGGGTMDGYVAGLDVMTGALIPVPDVSIGLRGEYVGVQQISGKGTNVILFPPLGDYTYTDDNGMADLMLGLDFGMKIPYTHGMNLGLSAWTGYGEGLTEQKTQVQTAEGSSSDQISNAGVGGAWVSEVEARIRYPLFWILKLYTFAGYRFVNALPKTEYGSVSLGMDSFSGATAGGGLTLDF